MPGTKEGGYKTAQTNKELHGEDFYKRIGKLGGAKRVSKGFGCNPALARKAGAKGGKISRRGPIVVEEEHKWYAKLKHTLKIK